MEELKAFKNKINWKNSRNLTTFVYVHSFFMLSSPVDRAAAHVHFVPEPKHIVCVANVHSCSALNYHTEASAICCFEKCHQVVPKASIVEMGRSSFSVLVTQSELYAECRAMLSAQTSFA